MLLLIIVKNLFFKNKMKLMKINMGGGEEVKFYGKIIPLVKFEIGVAESMRTIDEGLWVV